MLRLLGFHGSPVSRLPIGVALLAFGLWRHGALAVLAGAVLLVWGAVGMLGGERAGRDDPSRDRWR
jgi:hypothetical protein